MELGSMQEMFNTMLRGLASQGWMRCGVVNQNNPRRVACMYRYAGKKCALGWLIPDELYDPEWDISKDGSAETVLRDLDVLEDLSKDELAFINNAQYAHDGGYTVEVMQKNYVRVALKYGLQWPADVEDV